MEDKELLAAWEKIGQIYGPQKRTYDEFKFQMQSGEYRKKVFNNLGDNAKSVWGYDNYDQFNADKFLPTPTLSINNIPESADNLPRFNASSSTFVDQTTDVARKSSNPKLSGGTGPGGNSRRVSPRTQAIIDSNKSKKEEAKKQASLERAKVAAATTSDLVTQKADFYDVLRNYSNASGNELFASQLDYNNDKLTGVEKGDFEQKAINFLSEDMFSVVDDTENSQVWKEYGDEYGFLINQLNSQGKEIKILQDQLGTETDPTRKQDLIDEINDIMSEGADYKSNKPTQTGVSNKIYKYGSYEDMQERFSKLNSLPEFKNYQRAINILGKVREVSENFDTRNPEWVENQKNLKGAQAYVDMKDKYDLPDAEIPGQMPQPKWFKNNISKPIVSSLAKGVNDILSLPRTLSFNDEYGWTDSLAEASERIFSKEKNPNMVAQLGQSSNKDRGLSERVAMVDDYQLVVDDNIGAEYRSAKTVRDKDGYLVQDNEIVKQVIEKYEANPEEYKSEQQYNLEGALPKFVGVMADLGILMIGTKGLGTGVKATGALAKGSGLTRAGNYLSKSTVANRIALTGAVTGQTHNQLYGEAIRQGMTPAEASAFAVTGSLAVAAVAQINPQFYLIGEKKAASKLTERYIAYLAQGGKESKSTAFKYAMKEVFGAGKREFLEELAEIPALNAVRGGFNQVMSPEKSFEIEWSRGEIEESGIFGLAAGTSTGPLNITSQSSLQQQATYASYKAKEKFFERLDNLVGKQYMDPEGAKMFTYTKEQADAKKAEFASLFNQLDAAKLSTNKLSEESESKLLSLFQSSNNIKRLMDNAEGNPALMKVLEAQYALTNDAIAEELENNKKQPKVEPKTEGESSVPTELTEERKSEMDSFLDNDSELELNGTVKPDPKVEGDQKTETKEERYNDSQVPVSQQKITYEDGNGETNIATVTTQLDGSRKVQISDEKGAVFSRETISKDNTLTNEEYVSVSTEGDVKQTEDVDIKSVINPKLESRMSDRQRKEAGMDVAPNSNPKIEGDQNTITNPNQNTKSDFNENIVPGHFTMLYNDAFGIKVYGPKDKNGTKDLDKAVNRAMKESKTYQEALGKLKTMLVNPEGGIKQNSKPKPLFTKEEVNTAKANNDYLTPLVEKLKKNFPGVEVVVDEQAIVDLAKSRKNVSDAAARGAKGVFDFANNRVIINPKTATKDTPIHEFGHVWSSITKKQRPDLHKKGLELIKESKILQELKDRIANDSDQKKVYGEDTAENEENLLEEALAIAIGRRGAKLYDDSAKQSKWDKYLQEFFDYIKTQFGIDPKQAIEDLTLREFIELASTEIITGQEIAPVESKAEPEVKVDDNGQTLLFQANFLDPQTGLLYSYDKNGKKFKLLEAFGDITRDKELEYFADKHMVLHTPDFAFSGQISAKNGEIIVEGKGGMYYPIKFHEKGFFWASTESGADSLVKTLNESLKKNPDGKIYMGLVTAQASKLLSSTTASNAVVDIFTTKTFIDGLGLNKSQVNRALVNAANDTTTKKTKKKDKEGNIIKVKGKPVMIDKITGLRANTKNRFSVENNLKLIRTKLANDKSSFEDRKQFVQSFLDRLAQNVNPKALDAKGKMKFIKSDKITKTNAQVFKFFKDTIGYDQMTGTGGRISKANLTEAVSYMLGEPLLRGEAETNKIYAVVEIDTKLSTFKSDAHESYPKAIGVDPKETNSRTKLHILKDRKDWRDHTADPETDTNIELGRPRNKDGKARSYIQILPTTVGLTYAPVRILNKSENPGLSFQLDGDTNKKQVYDAITKFKELGKFTEGEIVQYFNQRFPDISVKELGEMYTGKVPEDSPRSEKRKYTSRLEQVLSEETFQEISDEAKTYIPKRNNITQAEADFMFEKLGLEDSVVIIKSNPDWLLPEVRIALTNKVITALEAEIQKLRTEGKDSEANLISASINNIVEQISKEGTKAGRFIQAFSLLKALSADRTVSLVNKKLKEAGKQPLTKDEETELKRLKNNSEDAAEGLPKSEAMALEYKYIQQLIGSNFKDVFVAYFYASILSGVPTQIKNIFANVMSISNELFVTSLREGIKGNPAAIFQAPLGMIKGLSKGWLNAKHILETGVKSDKSNKFDNPTLLEWWRFNTNNTVIGKLLPKKVTDNADWLLNSKLLPWSPNFLKYVQRAMVAGDQLFFHSAKEMQARALAYRIKNGKNATPEDIKRAETIINPPKESLERAKAEARLENYKDGTTQFKIRVHELMEANRDMTVQGQSEDFAAKTTFNYEPEGGLSYLYNFIVQSRQMDYVGPVMTTFIPFARVLTNVFNRFLHYTPIGAVTAARGKVRMASGKTRILSSEEKADLYIKASMGFSTLMGLVGYLMTHADDEDAVLKISASGPRDFNKKYELKKAGWKPFTVTIGDASFSYQDHPLYFILAAAGTLYESDKYGNSIDGEGNADLFSYVTLTTAMSMLQQSWLQGLSDLGRILNSDDPAKAIANKTFGVLNAVAMPNFHKQLVRGYMEIMDDPIKARRNGTLTGAIDQLYRDIPIANSGLYDMVDNYGDPIIPEQGQKLIPLDFTWGEKGDPLAKHFVGEGVYVGSASNRKIEDYDLEEERYLKDDEYQVYKIESAKAVGKILRENSSYLRNLKGEELGLAVRDLKKEARDNTLYDLFYYDGYKKLKK